MTNAEMIKQAKRFRDEIAGWIDDDYNKLYFICYQAEYKPKGMHPQDLFDFISCMADFGEKYVLGFRWLWSPRGRFDYLAMGKIADDQPRVYNAKKLEHLEAFIEWLEQDAGE